MWSQMHGNEATTTKALLDLINELGKGGARASALEASVTLRIIPQLNPDGAQAYTRVNANGKDLNRDAKERTQPESRILREQYEGFAPHFCFNLHDQRTIYNVGETATPATLSFLAPSMDAGRSVPPQRQEAMQLIAAMAADLKPALPGGIGRYDDGFNPNCVGDQFQMAGTPTLLFEAGHYPGDYQREETRYYVYAALVSALYHISQGTHRKVPVESYAAIPENGKLMVDLLVKHAEACNPALARGTSLAIQYREALQAGRIAFIPEWPEEGLTLARFAHETLDAATPQGREALNSRSGLLSLIQGVQP